MVTDEDVREWSKQCILKTMATFPNKSLVGLVVDCYTNYYIHKTHLSHLAVLKLSRHQV